MTLGRVRELPEATSVRDPVFAERAYEAIRRNGEALVEYYAANSGGWSELHVVQSQAEVAALFRSGKQRSIFDVYLAPQLPIRGIADAAAQARVVEALRAEKEVVMATRSERGSFLSHLGTYLDHFGTDEESDIVDWFREHQGLSILAGPDPARLPSESPFVASGRVPDADGRIRSAAF